jgi:hypothetical protein
MVLIRLCTRFSPTPIDVLAKRSNPENLLYIRKKVKHQSSRGRLVATGLSQGPGSVVVVVAAAALVVVCFLDTVRVTFL